MAWLLDPYEYEFFREGVAVASLAGALCGLVGAFVVLKRMSYLGHGLSHAVFGGYATSTLLGLNLVVGAGTWGVASALLVTAIARRRTVGADAAIGVVTTASFALGLALLAAHGRRGRNVDAALFGSILGVETADVVGVSVVLAAVAAVVFAGYRPLLFTTFDPAVAGASGVRTGVVDAALMVALSASILAAMQVLGVTLVAAAVVIPPSAARLLTNSFSHLLWLSVAIGTLSGLVGMNVSYHLDIPSGPAITLTAAGVFALAYAATAARRPARRAVPPGR